VLSATGADVATNPLRRTSGLFQVGVEPSGFIMKRSLLPPPRFDVNAIFDRSAAHAGSSSQPASFEMFIRPEPSALIA